MKAIVVAILAVFLMPSPAAIPDDVGGRLQPLLPELVQAYVALGEAEMLVRLPR